MKCLAEYVKSTIFLIMTFNSINFFKETPEVNATIKYWLSGVNVGCASNYVWCSVNLPLDSSAKMWSINEPLKKSANNSNCVAAYLNSPNYGISLEPCDSQHGVLCE
jgi:hypothetical protein